MQDISKTLWTANCTKLVKSICSSHNHIFVLKFFCWICDIIHNEKSLNYFWYRNSYLKLQQKNCKFSFDSKVKATCHVDVYCTIFSIKVLILGFILYTIKYGIHRWTSSGRGLIYVRLCSSHCLETYQTNQLNGM